MTPKANVDRLRAALEASTQGEWHGCHDGNCVCGTISSHDQDFMIARTELNHFEDAPQQIPVEVYTANAKFIFIAHNEMPALLDTVTALETEVTRLRRALKPLVTTWKEWGSVDWFREVFDNTDFTAGMFEQASEALAATAAD